MVLDLTGGLPMPDTTLAVDIPGMPPTPVIGWRGNMLRFFRDPITYLDQSKPYGDVVAFAHGGNSNLLATVDNCPVWNCWIA